MSEDSPLRKWPAILCPARGMLERLPARWPTAVVAGRMLVLSCFPKSASRVTAELADRRSECVAALADDVYTTHTTLRWGLESIVTKEESERSRVINSLADGCPREGDSHPEIYADGKGEFSNLRSSAPFADDSQADGVGCAMVHRIYQLAENLDPRVGGE